MRCSPKAYVGNDGKCVDGKDAEQEGVEDLFPAAGHSLNKHLAGLKVDKVDREVDDEEEGAGKEGGKGGAHEDKDVPSYGK